MSNRGYIMKKFINNIKLFIRYILAAWEENRYRRRNKFCSGCSHFKSFMGTAGICEYQNIGHNSFDFKDFFDRCNCNKFTADKFDLIQEIKQAWDFSFH